VAVSRVYSCPGSALCVREGKSQTGSKTNTDTNHLKIEILSPSTHAIDAETKKALYERHGVFEYLLVYPEEKKVESFLLRKGKYTDPKTYLKDEQIDIASMPGLMLDLKQVF